jgi:ATP-dependent Clp protease ATP-binding subunit ClpB
MEKLCIGCGAKITIGTVCDNCLALLKEKSREKMKNQETEEDDETPVTQERKPIYINSKGLYQELSNRIKGQDSALREIVRILKIHLAKATTKRPASIFLYGASGVGKTASALAIFEQLNQIMDIGFIRIDCNAFVESHRVAQFLGAPQSYKDSGEPNIFTKIIDQPYQIIIFEEIEKAHANVLTVILGILDHGILTLSSPLKEKDKDGNPIIGNEGKDGVSEINFKNTFIFFTSNLDLNTSDRVMGFVKEDGNLISENDKCKAALVRHGVRIEIASRISSFIKFDDLCKSDIKEIVRLEIEQTVDDFNLSVEHINDNIINEILKATCSKFGVRAYKQLIEGKIGETIADYLEEPENESSIIEIGGTLDKIMIIPCEVIVEDDYEYNYFEYDEDFDEEYIFE